MKSIFLLVCLIISVNGYLVNNNFPIIGLLTQPSTKQNLQFGYQYFVASYVKFIESGGGRVVPILFDKSESEIIELLGQLNGVLLPGGVDYNIEKKYTSTLYTIWNYVLETNKNCDYFPIWGTCLGFEEIVSVASTFDVITDYNGKNQSIPLNFTCHASTSKMFKHCPSNIYKSLSKEPITFNHHFLGLSPTNFYNNNNLTTMFNVLSTNNDLSGNEFVSSIESKKYPIYGVMWHPEKPANHFHEMYDINHSFNSILASQYFSNFFISECRKSKHTFKDNDNLYNSLIYNYTPIYAYNVTTLEQTYYFNKS